MTLDPITTAESDAIAHDVGQQARHEAQRGARGLFVGRGLRSLRSDQSADTLDVLGVEYRRLTPQRWETILESARDYPERAISGVTEIEKHLRAMVAEGHIEEADFFPLGKLPPDRRKGK